MKRPKQHEIDTRANRIFKFIIPDNWVVRDLTLDYGLDHEVEVFKDGRPTGVTFLVQLKGTERAHYVGDRLHFAVETDKLLYYLKSVTRPVFLIIVDVSKRKAFWLFAQEYTNEVLPTEKPGWCTQRTVTLRIPKTQVLPDALGRLEQTARSAMEYVFMLQFGLPHWSAVAKVQGILDDAAALERAVRGRKAEVGEMGMHIARLYIRGDRLGEAQKRIRELFEASQKENNIEQLLRSALAYGVTINPAEKGENRFAASLLQVALSRGSSCDKAGLVLLAKGELAFLDFIFRFNRVSELDLLISVTEHGTLGTDALLKLFRIQEQNSYVDAVRELEEAISKTIDAAELHPACILLVRLADTNLFAYPHVRLRLGSEKSAALLESAQRDLNTARKLAKSLGDAELECFAMQSQANLMSCAGDPAYKEILADMRNIAEEHGLTTFTRAAEHLREAFDQRKPLPEQMPEPIKDQEITEEQELAIIQKLAEAAGIDLEDGSGEISQIVRIGIRDKNPERVLKFCQHLHVALGAHGLPAEMLGLPTAGSKFLYCELAENGVCGLQLDDLFSYVKETCCEHCKNSNPQPDDWKWTRQWQQEREKNRPAGMQKFMDSI